MSETKPLYSGEALLRNWSESASGKRRIILEIEDNGGAHPFKGYEGERFGVVIVGPLASAEHTNLGLGEDASGERPAQPRGKGAAEGTGAMRADPSSPKPKRRWQDMPASQRAALMVKDVEFQRYVSERWRSDVDESAADYNLKKFCKVNSKADLSTDEYSADRLDKLQSDFRAWQQARGHGVI